MKKMMMICLFTVVMSNMASALMKVKADFVKMDQGCYTIHVVITAKDQDGTIYVVWSGNVKVGSCPKLIEIGNTLNGSTDCPHIKYKELELIQIGENSKCLSGILKNNEDIDAVYSEISKVIKE